LTDEASAKRFVLYGDHRSGNCWKPALALHLTGREYEWRETSVLDRETRSPAFLAMNPNGKVPLLRLPDGRFLAESNAMLLYLAEGSSLLPEDPFRRALVHQWLFWEQYSHEPYIAVARFLLHFDHGLEVLDERLAYLHQRGCDALALMDGELGGRQFIAGDGFTVADIALYAYTHKAAEGGFDLQPYARVRRWLRDVAARPGHFDLEALPK